MALNSDFDGSIVRGIPVGVPFRCSFCAPDEKKSLFKVDIYTFILLPLSESDCRDYDKIIHMTNDAESVQCDVTATEKGHEVLNEIEQYQKIENDDDQKSVDESSSIDNVEHKDETEPLKTFQDTSLLKVQKLGKSMKQGEKRKKSVDSDKEWGCIETLTLEKNIPVGEEVRRSSRVKIPVKNHDYMYVLDEFDSSDSDSDKDLSDPDDQNTDAENKNKVYDKSDYDYILELDNDVDIDTDDTDTDHEVFDEMETISSRKKKRKKERNSIETGRQAESKNNRKLSNSKTKEWIKVKLEDHMDKYREDLVPSYCRKDRGRSVEECSVKLFVCTVCEKFRTEAKLELENHIEMHVNGELHCEDCDYVGSYVREIQKHRGQVHKKNVNICSECGKEIFNGRYGLKNHMGKEHDRPQWECVHCRKDNGKHVCFTVRRMLWKHIQNEHTEKLEKCDKCKKLFSNKFLLQKHASVDCLGEKPPNSYPCEKCGKSYSTLKQVEVHIFHVHHNVRKYQCPQCPFASGSTGGLASHLNTHTGYHPFKCDICTFSCIQRFQLTSHMRTHTGEKPYKCSKCNYAAAWKVQLKEHGKVHVMPEAVTCEKCNIVFKDNRSLKNHERKDHINEVHVDPKTDNCT